MTEHLESEQLPSTQIDFTTILNGVEESPEIFSGIKEAMQKGLYEFKKEKGIERIGFVSGRLGEDGKDPKLSWKKDAREMRQYAQQLREEHKFPIFMSLDFLSGKVWDRIESLPIPKDERSQKINDLCCQVVGECGVTDLFSMLNGEKAKGAILVSDAFFPFPDNIERAAEAGVSLIMQPGGSIRDEEVIAEAKKHNLTMVFTGVRHFKH